VLDLLPEAEIFEKVAGIGLSRCHWMGCASSDADGPVPISPKRMPLSTTFLLRRLE
jgi:hypothetical protein